MDYCKIVQNDIVVDASNTFVIWNNKYNMRFLSGIDRAQFAESHDGQKLYHASWLKSIAGYKGAYEMAEIIMIDEDEYDEIMARLEDNEVIPIIEEPEPEPEPEPVEEVVEEEKPMTISEMRTKIKELTELVNHLVAMTGDEQHVD